MEPGIAAMRDFVSTRLEADFDGTGLPKIEFRLEPSGDVIDELGRPWPELLDSGGEFVGVLVPPADTGGSGIAHWALRAEPFCAIGQLHPAVKAAGLRIK